MSIRERARCLGRAGIAETRSQRISVAAAWRPGFHAAVIQTKFNYIVIDNGLFPGPTGPKEPVTGLFLGLIAIVPRAGGIEPDPGLPAPRCGSDGPGR
jgi:hypothetical protein